MNTDSRNLDITLWIENGNAMCEIYCPECSDRTRIAVPYSPDDHAEFNEQIGEQLYFWLTDLAEREEERNA